MEKTISPYFHVTLASLMVAGWVCVDPLVSYILGIDRFPYFLTVIVGSIIVIVVGLSIGMPKIYQHKDAVLLIFIIGMAQLSGIGIASIDLLDVAILCLTCLWLLFALVESDRPIQVSPIMLGIMGLMFLSILALINQPPLSGLVAISEKFILFFILVALLRRRSLVKLSAYTLIFAGMFSSIIAITQAVLFWVWGILWTTGTSETQSAGYLKPTPFGIMPRVTGFFPNPAGLNDYLLFTTCMALFAIVSTKSVRMKWIFSLILLLNIAAITLTWSASSLSGLALALVLFFYVNRPSLAIHYTAAIVLIVIVSYWTGLLGFMYLLMKSYASSSGEIRLRLLELAMDSLVRNPFIGLGVQNFASASGNLFQEGVFTFSYPVHNVFGQMATELGVFGALIYLGIVAFIVARIIRMLRISQLDEQWIFKSQLLALVPLIMHMFSEPMAFEGTLWLFFGFIEGSALAILKSPKLAKVQSVSHSD